MKSIIFKVLFIVVFTFIATGKLYPLFEGKEYENEIYEFVFFASAILFVLTEILRYFHRIFQHKKFTFFSLVFNVAVLLFSIFGLSTTITNYLEYKNDFTALYPPQSLNEELDAQDRIVISDSSYYENPLKWIDANGGLGVRKEAFEPISLAENERKIYKNFSMFLAFSFLVFFSIIEIRFYGKKWQIARKVVDNSKEKVKEQPETVLQKEKIISDEHTLIINKARDLVAKARADEALKELTEICPKNSHFQNQLIALKTRLASNKIKNIQGTLDNKSSILTNQINQGILELIDEIESEFKNDKLLP